jgi:hypothetical protein
MGKMLIILGIFIFIIGTIVHFSGNSLCNLPGDITIRGQNFTFYFPIASGIVLSIILTIIINLLFKILK